MTGTQWLVVRAQGSRKARPHIDTDIDSHTATNRDTDTDTDTHNHTDTDTQTHRMWLELFGNCFGT